MKDLTLPRCSRWAKDAALKPLLKSCHAKASEYC